MARKKKYRMKKDLDISREDALYLLKCTEPQKRYILNQILIYTPKEKEKKPIIRKSKNIDIIDSEFNKLKIDNPNRTDNILNKAANCKVGNMLSKNKYEDCFKGILDSMEILYEYQKIFMNDRTFYVVDFYLPEFNVVCEIDGVIHDYEKSMVKDEQRTRILKTQNKVTDVFRFYNDDVENNQSSVCESLDFLLSNIY